MNSNMLNSILVIHYLLRQKLQKFNIIEKLDTSLTANPNENYNKFHEIITLVIKRHLKLKIVKYDTKTQEMQVGNQRSDKIDNY